MSWKKHYELTEAHRLGPGKQDDKEARVLNRLVRWTNQGLEYEADPRQAEKLLRDLRLDEGTKSLGTPGVKITKDQLAQEEELAPEKKSPYRAIVARANYLSADRPDCQFSAKEVCRWMSNPINLFLRAVKRLGRYLKGKKRLIYKFVWQKCDMIDVYSDTDWAGCIKIRKSTSGGCIMIGMHLIKSWF